jgi:HAD superfamily hydrolase (TIGR01509 family)
MNMPDAGCLSRRATRQIRAALFDVDGTLIDSNDLHVKAWQRAFASFDIEVSTRALHEQMGNGGDRVVRAFCTPAQARKWGKKLIARHVEIFTRDYIDEVRPFPGVRDLFQRLRADRVRIALASSAQKQERDRHIAMLGIADLLDAATTGQAVEHTKPCPDIFQTALARLGGIAPQAAAVIGDSPWDAIAARSGGMCAIGVLSGGFSRRRLSEAGAKPVFRDVAHLLESYDASPFASSALALT